MLLHVLLAVALATASPAADVYAAPGHRVSVDGHLLNLVCQGSGPVVVFDAGLGDWSPTWIRIQSKIAAHGTACSYDRAGYGFSEPASSPRTSATIARELHALLHAAKLPGPYILVGHSFGGLNVQAFTELYRGEVAGLVLVDGTAADVPFPAALQPLMNAQLAAFQKCATAARNDTFARTPLFTTCFSMLWGTGSHPSSGVTAQLTAAVKDQARKPAPYAAVISEMQSVTQSQREVRERERPLGNLPLIVLTATTHGEKDVPPAMGAALQRFEPQWRKAHRRTAALSTRGRYELVQSGHYIQFDRPDVVIDAVQSVVLQVAAGTVR